MDPESDFEARLRLMEDEGNIRETLDAYGYALNEGDLELWSTIWTDDAVWSSSHRDSAEPPNVKCGVSEILGGFSGRDRKNPHLVAMPRIKIEGNSASVYSTFVTLVDSPAGAKLRAFGTYTDTLERGADGKWRIKERIAIRESILS